MGRGGKENATYVACPGSYTYPGQVFEPEVIVLAGARGWGLKKAMGRCVYCRKLLIVTKNGWLPRHKREHEKGWERER